MSKLEEYLQLDKQEELSDEELERIRIEKLNKRLSTDILTADILNNSLNLNLPEDIIKRVLSDIDRKKFILEFRQSKRYDGRFPEGNTMVKDTNKFLEDICNIKEKYMFDIFTRPTVEAIDIKIKQLCNIYINDYNSYIEYI